MASRYNRNGRKVLPDGRRVFRPKIYKNIPKRDSDIYIVTQGGDRLDTIAYQMYGDSSLWWIIAAANNIHDATFAVKEGTVLRVPENYNQILNNI
jgi:phage tail protein X